MSTDAWTFASAERPSTAAGRTRLLVPVDPTDGWPRAIPEAVAVAQRRGCPITLFGWSWDAALADAMRWKLDLMAAELGVPVHVEVACTDDHNPVASILHAARAEPGTTICMATHARSRVGVALLGSTAEEIVRRATEPVLLIGPHVQADQHDPSGPVIASVDGSTFSEHIVPEAARWATELGLPFEVVGVVEPLEFEDVDVRRDRLEVLESGYVARVAKHARDDATWEVLHGDDPAHAVVDYARGRASLLAMCTHGRSGLARVVAGSVALRVVHHAPCPVLVLRPPDLR
jgi:nucleotide-binding universal stress UspA family protein